MGDRPWVLPSYGAQVIQSFELSDEETRGTLRNFVSSFAQVGVVQTEGALPSDIIHCQSPAVEFFSRSGQWARAPDRRPRDTAATSLYLADSASSAS